MNPIILCCLRSKTIETVKKNLCLPRECMKGVGLRMKNRIFYSDEILLDDIVMVDI